jgi:hypothetical protein
VNPDVDILAVFLAAGRALWRLLTNAELANLASLIGLGLSVYVLRTVQDLRKRVMLKMRAPEVIHELNERASTISNAMHDFAGSLPIIEQQIALAHETLKNVRDKTAGETKRTIKVSINKIAQFRRLSQPHKGHDAVEKIYLQLLVAAKAIENTVADFREEP